MESHKQTTSIEKKAEKERIANEKKPKRKELPMRKKHY